MAVSALIKFTQGPTVGGNGEALFGNTDAVVSVANVDGTGVASWQVDLVFVPPDSALAVATIASADGSGTVSATFTPDVPGAYRVVVKVWDVPNRVGDPADTDIRVFGVRETNGLFVPAPQIWPRALPPVASGEVGAKPDEHNFDGQENGWSGTGSEGLLGETIKRVDAAIPSTDGSPPPYVMEFGGEIVPGGQGPHVNHGRFWPEDQNIGDCWWQFWAWCDLDSGIGYVISDGYGGSHSMLTGMQSTTGGFRVSGNFRRNSPNITIEYVTQDCDKIQLREWKHVTVSLSISGIDTICVYIDGILSAFQSFGAGTRQSGIYSNSDGPLFVGGSNHLMWKGRIAWMVGFDCNVFGPNDPTQAWYAFRPWFEPQIANAGLTAFADFVGDYTKPGTWVPDLAINQIPPLTGTRNRVMPIHPGIPEYSGDPYLAINEPPYVRPYWVLDPTFPGFQVGPRTVENALVKDATSPPSDGQTTLLWDDFSGRRSTFVETAFPTLGSTIAGTLSPQAWLYRPDVAPDTYTYGIFCGNAVRLGRGFRESPAYLDCGQVTHGVEFQRPAGSDGGTQASYNFGPGVVFRMVDLNNFWVACILHDDLMTLSYYSSGVKTDVVTDLAVPNSWTGLRAVINNSTNTITLYTSVNYGTSWQTLGSPTVSAVNAGGTKVGIVSGQGSYSRWREFRCFVPA